MSTQLFTTYEADAQILKARTWWATNRPAAPNLLKEELAQAFARLQAHPEIGTPKPRKHFPDLRWVVLRRTKCLLYYEYNPSKDVVRVVSLRSASRKPGHRIRR